MGYIVARLIVQYHECNDRWDIRISKNIHVM
jgi:hypothetical protein